MSRWYEAMHAIAGTACAAQLATPNARWQCCLMKRQCMWQHAASRLHRAVPQTDMQQAATCEGIGSCFAILSRIQLRAYQ